MTRQNGRKPLIETSPRIANDIVALLRSGHSQAQACAAVGVPLKTFESWLQRGRNDSNPKAVYKQFADEVDAAYNRGIVDLQRVVEAHARNDPETAMRMLAIRDPERYGNRRLVQIRYVQEQVSSPLAPEPIVPFDEWALEDLETYIAILERNGIDAVEARSSLSKRERAAFG